LSTVMNIRFSLDASISWVGQEILASQKGPCSVDLVY
jgi:hypothetical protein